jgi:hypothetical protein
VAIVSGSGDRDGVGDATRRGSTIVVGSRAQHEEEPVDLEFWQIVVFAFVVLLPMALMLDFWPHRERLNYRGQPVARTWERQYTPRLPDEHH